MAPRQWRVSISIARGTFNTSHVAECPDVAPECATMTIDPHMHGARMALTHMDLSAQYGLRENLQFSVRVPYDVKDLRIRYTTLDNAPFTPPYGDIHHRTQTLTGISDPSISLGWGMGSGWIAGAGVTLPVGRTEKNPIILGREGKQHQHVQFGSGTFQPKLSLQYVHPGAVSLFGRAEATVSLYENGEGFRAPSTFAWFAGPGFTVRGISISPRFEGQHQTIGRWNGEIDEGSGFTNGGVRVGVSVPAGPFSISPSMYRELFSHGAHGEVFRQGTSWSLSLSRTY